MSAKPAAIPLFGDAYLADTRHLTTEEHGAYLLLIMAAWRQDDCGLPNDDKKLARIAGLSARKWSAIKDTILEFWTEEGGRIYQDRLTREWNYVRQKSESNRKNSGKRWNKQDIENKQGDGCDGISDGNAPPPPPIIEEPIGSSPPEGSTRRKSRSAGANERSEGLNPRSTGRNPPAQTPIPDWVPAEQWNAFLEMRREKKKFPSEHAVRLLVGKLEKLRRDGHDPGAVLDQSTVNNWTDVYGIKDQRNGSGYQQKPARSGDGALNELERRIQARRAAQPAGEDRRSDFGEGGSVGELPFASTPIGRPGRA